jgi:hypothetical protein
VGTHDFVQRFLNRSESRKWVAGRVIVREGTRGLLNGWGRFQLWEVGNFSPSTYNLPVRPPLVIPHTTQLWSNDQLDPQVKFPLSVK